MATTAEKIEDFAPAQAEASAVELFVKKFVTICRPAAAEGTRMMATSKLLKREHALETVSLTVAWILASLPIIAVIAFSIAAKGTH